MHPKTLQQRIALFILIPVFFILAGMGWASFLYIRNAMQKQWGEIAIAKLQTAAHMIDMRLSKPKDMMLMLKNNDSQKQNSIIRAFVIQEFKQMEGVVDVVYDFLPKPHVMTQQPAVHMMHKATRHFNRMGKIQLSRPRYNTTLNSETVSLSAEFKDAGGITIGRIEVVLSFKDLIDQISKATWWKSNKAFLIDNEGNILSTTKSTEKKGQYEQLDRFARTDLLEQQTLAALKDNQYGTIFGPGHPPEEISGYYHLKEAPWSLVLISPGRQVLKSILNFRLFYFFMGFVSILGVILFIRGAISGTTDAIKKISGAARNLTNGIFTDPLPVLSRDEVGELTSDFNKMTKQLKERLELKEAMSIAKAVQQSLLPPATVSYPNLEISGCSVYCHETGGDYFDIIAFPDDSGKIYVAVGDVVGHGIGAALLMATTRALLRSRVMQKGSLSEILNDVNRLLFLDSADTGSFVTFFLTMVDLNKGELHWVRAGHEPAMVYNPGKDEMTELYGEGIVLGLDDQWAYTENVFSDIPEGTVVLICTDGAWEVENKAGERFGKNRVEKVLQQSSSLSSEEIINAIILETKKFRGKFQQNDDITLLALKFK